MRWWLRVLRVVVVAGFVAAGCASQTVDTTTTSTTSSISTTSSTTTSTVAASSTTTTTTPASTTTSTVAEAPAFRSSVQEIDFLIEQRMTNSWREGCPVGLEQLRLLTLNYWNYSNAPATGELVVHEDWATEIVQVFETLYNNRFPIQRMELVDVHLGDDDLSMAANNTSAFNCREVAFRPGVWSNHAFGLAIDINPLVNPYVSPTGDEVLPPAGADFLDRSDRVQGGIYAGDVVTQAFADIGWAWGGDWANGKDWQHFSATGG